MRTKKQSLLIILAYLIIDVCCIAISLIVALWLRKTTVPFSVSFEGFFSSANPFKALFLLWTPLILFFNQTRDLYQTHREQLETIEIWEVIKSVVSATLVLMVVAYLMRVTDFPRSIMFIGGGLMAVTLSLWRVCKKLLVNYMVENGYNNFNAIIIGAGKVGTLLSEEITKRPSLGVKVIGFLDDYKTDACSKGKCNILGGIAQFEEIAKREFVNKIFITIYHNSDVFVKLLEKARELKIAVRVVPQGYEWMTHEATKYNVGIIPVLAYSDIDVNYRLRTKRVFDLIMGWMIFIGLLPVFAVIAVLIKMDAPGPIFYYSKRYGQQGKIFNMFKFRSMVSNADDLLKDLRHKNEVDGPIFKIRKDPRITKFGAFLRKFSLDELPQIINVINGEMSLVGPRPLPIDQVEKEDFRQLKRLDIRPGITGLWQVKGRSDVSFDRLVRWDIWYINNWSFGLDLYILMQTVPVVLKGRGAY